MADVTSQFFERLSQRDHEPMLGRSNGSLRIDLDRDGDVEHWRVDVRRGAVTVSHAAGPADCVLRADAALFEDLARGRANALAATLRGQIVLEGDQVLLVRFQRLFPAPTGRKMTSSARTVGRRRG
jgi:putative sterol carrier protein